MLRLKPALFALSVALGAPAAATAAPLIQEPLPVGQGLAVTMAEVILPPAASDHASTVGQHGHSHPGATYVYVAEGAVRSRLGSGPETLFEKGGAWAEKPGEAHYIVNASRSAPARLVVFFVVPAGTTTLTRPLP